ncbi:hypothetical protein FA95DRAFT_1488392 [Auriscalpium vulgare]|uniref:Uncharacterized protein n=1 Tax=Auriscalpium vulgare TaxID=40419 RepID=A0ACB8S1X6_9AGAM|nr:hypothetical protein FA95DRAFT_1488392 [Auriscalpium vulgare]
MSGHFTTSTKPTSNATLVASKLGESPGTPQFFPALLNHIKSTAPGLPIEPVIFQSILLCLLAGPGRNLLLRTREEDVGVVQSLATLILTDVMGLKTQRPKLNASLRPSPSTFVSSLFFSRKQKRLSSGSRQVSPFRTRAKRSRSYPLPAGPDAAPRISASEDGSGGSPAIYPRELGQYRPLSRPSLRALSHSDPVTAAPVPESPVLIPSSEFDLPHALVLSGLEHASIPCQRALLHTLLEQRVTLDDGIGGKSWSLPDDFFLICVCPWDPRERPPLQKSLLDKFSMSATIGLHASTRQAYATYLSAHLPSSQSLHTPATPSTPALFSPASLASPASAPLPLDLISRLRELSSPTHVSLHPTLRVYMADLFAAARHYHELDGTLLSARAMGDAEALVRAHRMLGGTVNLVQRAVALEAQALAQMRLQSQSALSGTYETSARDALTFEGIAHEADINDGHQVQVQLQWGNSEALSDNTAGGPMAASTFHPSVASNVSLEHSEAHSPAHPVEHQQPEIQQPVEWLHQNSTARWDVSEIDVAKIVPRVITHRLRVRDGPEDELLSSVVCTAVPPQRSDADNREEEDGMGGKETWRRRTVKEILVKLMAEV